jgi:hypothetical protein
LGTFTFVPVWVIQDLIVLLLALVTILFIIRREKNPAAVFLELVCFVLLNAAVFENFATLRGWYGYGRSILMIFNVPLSVPVLEYLVVYASLRMLESMKIKTWCKPFIVGAFGMLADLSLDPLAVRQVFFRLKRELSVGGRGTLIQERSISMTSRYTISLAGCFFAGTLPCSCFLAAGGIESQATITW